MRKWEGSGPVTGALSGKIPVLTGEEFEALEEFLRYTVRDRRRRGRAPLPAEFDADLLGPDSWPPKHPMCGAITLEPEDPEPIEVGQVWRRESDRAILEIQEYGPDSVDLAQLGYAPCINVPIRDLRLDFTRLPFCREEGSP